VLATQRDVELVSDATMPARFDRAGIVRRTIRKPPSAVSGDAS
jgi:hypothetical protein